MPVTFDAGGEGADLEVAGACISRAVDTENVWLDKPGSVRFHDHYIGHRLQPGSVVGVMLHVRQKHDRPVLLHQVDLVLVLFADSQPEDPLELVHHRGHAKPRRDDDVGGTGMHVPLDNVVRGVVRTRHGGTRNRDLRVRVGYERTDTLAHDPLDRRVQPSARNPIGIDDPLRAKGRVESLIDPDDIVPKWPEVAVHARTL